MPLCKHDINATTCGDCSPRPPARPLFSQPGGYGPWFPARFDSECDGCGCPVGEGDQIRADGAGGYLCEDCGDGE